MVHEQHIISLQAASTLGELFHERVLRTPDAPAYQQFRDDRWQSFTWQQTQNQVARWQAAMQREKLALGDRVAIMASNSWEWVIFDQAAQGMGLVTVPIYTNDRAENIDWIIKDSGARLLCIQSSEQWKTVKHLASLATLERVVSLQSINESHPLLATVDAWLPDTPCVYQLTQTTADALATIVYTSGTTGNPKGVMLSHHNILWNVAAALKVIKVYQSDLLLSFLPLSHTFERTAGYYLPIATGTPVAYNRSIPELAEDLATVKPTVMISVPRIFERVHAKITSKVAHDSALKQKLFAKAVELGWHKFEHAQGRANWHPSLILQPVLDALVGQKVRARLGGRLRFTVCGGAALSEDIAHLFIGLGIPVLQGYGLTETSPVIAANTLQDNQPTSVGKALPGIEIKQGPHGELLTRSPSVMLGYWNNREGTRAIVDSEGWLHTGDQVQLDTDGSIQITGRLKEIIVMSNGEKVPPTDMENAIVLDELVDQVMVIGEGKPYLSAILVPNPEAFAEVAEHFHIDPANQHAYDDEHVIDLFMHHIAERTRSFPGYARIRQIAVVPEAWTPDNGLITPTMKLRRQRILAHYQAQADQLYAGH